MYFCVRVRVIVSVSVHTAGIAFVPFGICDDRARMSSFERSSFAFFSFLLFAVVDCYIILFLATAVYNSICCSCL